MDALDVAYILTILLILLGGAVCIAVFGSKEKTMRDNLSNSYRFRKKNGEVIRVKGKPYLFEPKSRYYYLDKQPFPSDVSALGVEGGDGKRYKAILTVTLFIPDDMAQTAAESFFGLGVEEISDMLAEPLEAILEETVKGYTGTQDTKEMASAFREKANAKLVMFGAQIMRASDIKIAEDKNLSA